jgi:hypothetical protein
MKTLNDLNDELGQWVFPCDCGDHRHGLVIGRWQPGEEISLTLAYFPLSWRDRLRMAWRILRYGMGDLDMETMLVRSENVGALCEAMRHAAREGETAVLRDMSREDK